MDSSDLPLHIYSLSGVQFLEVKRVSDNNEVFLILRSAKPSVSQFYYIASGDWLNNLFKSTGVFKSKKKSRG